MWALPQTFKILVLPPVFSASLVFISLTDYPDVFKATTLLVSMEFIGSNSIPSRFFSFAVALSACDKLACEFT